MSHSQLPQILRAMRVTLHVAFAVMLGVGIVRFIVTFDQHPAVLMMILILAFMLAGLYLVHCSPRVPPVYCRAGHPSHGVHDSCQFVSPRRVQRGIPAGPHDRGVRRNRCECSVPRVAQGSRIHG